MIGALLRHNDAVDLMGNLSAAQFYRHDHCLIFTVLRCQIGAGQNCDVISGGMALNGLVPDAMAYLNAMTQSRPAPTHLGHYADLVADRALRSALLTATTLAADIALHPGARSSVEVLHPAQGARRSLRPARDDDELVGRQIDRRRRRRERFARPPRRPDIKRWA